VHVDTVFLPGEGPTQSGSDQAVPGTAAGTPRLAPPIRRQRCVSAEDMGPQANSPGMLPALRPRTVHLTMSGRAHS